MGWGRRWSDGNGEVWGGGGRGEWCGGMELRGRRGDWLVDWLAGWYRRMDEGRGRRMGERSRAPQIPSHSHCYSGSRAEAEGEVWERLLRNIETAKNLKIKGKIMRN